MAGSFTSDNYEYISLSLKPCNGTGCQEAADIEAYISNLDISVLHTDTYVDQSDNADSLHLYTRDRFYHTIK